MKALVTTTGRTGFEMEAPSLLGEKGVRIPTSGKIRSGVKVLTKKAAENQKASDIYNRGFEAGASFDAIAQRIKEQCGIDWPLTPQNTPYFSARRCDFAMPEVAGLIMEKYGEDRGEGRHLYRFPVVFPVDSRLGVLPHGLKCHAASQLKYWSEYDAEGNRYCMMLQALSNSDCNKRAKRLFGGRQKVLRPDNDGVCNPSECAEYQDRKCNLSGSLVFYIPGIPGSSAIELPTTSFYSLDRILQTLGMVGHIRGGRISGTVAGRPIFYLTKVRRAVSMIKEDGTPTKVKQWIVELEADIDVSKLFEQSEPSHLLESGAAAVKALECSGEKGSEPDPYEAYLNTLGIEMEAFEAYASAKWGEQWRLLETDIVMELETAMENPEGYRQAISIPF